MLDLSGTGALETNENKWDLVSCSSKCLDISEKEKSLSDLAVPVKIA